MEHDREQLQQELAWHWYSRDETGLAFLDDAPAVSLMKALSGAVFLGGLAAWFRVRGHEPGWVPLLTLLAVAWVLKVAGDFVARRAWAAAGAGVRQRLRGLGFFARLALLGVGVGGGLLLALAVSR